MATSSVISPPVIVIPTQYDELQVLYKFSRELFYSKGIVDGKVDSSFLTTYVGAMNKLHLVQEIFCIGHQLVEKSPQSALTWYTVGSYYFSCGKLDMAEKHLKKAIKKDPQCTHAWILLGHILSLLEESEQAVAAYRSAVRLLPTHFLPLLCLGKEFIRTNNLSLAAHTLNGALSLNPMDAVVLNELGVVFVRLNRLREAAQLFNGALTVLQLEQQQPITSSNQWSIDMENNVIQQDWKQRYERTKIDDVQMCEVIIIINKYY
jgi:anaphase-promoting complex subunit 6